jgi:pimeloyl-ACP methyl ester carboxylesterase
LLFAATRPDRVRSLTVIASVSELGPETDRIVLDWREAAIASPQSLYRTMLPTTFSEEFIAANPRLTELGEERLQACEPGFFTAFAGLIDAFRDLDITPMLGEIRCPSLVIAAGKDRLKPPHYSRIIADGIPRADLLEIAGAGHAVILEQPDAVNSAIRAFLSQSPAR